MAWFNVCKLKITKMLKTGWRGLEKSELLLEQNFIRAISVLLIDLLSKST